MNFNQTSLLLVTSEREFIYGNLYAATVRSNTVRHVRLEFYCNFTRVPDVDYVVARFVSTQTVEMTSPCGIHLSVTAFNVYFSKRYVYNMTMLLTKIEINCAQSI